MADHARPMSFSKPHPADARPLAADAFHLWEVAGERDRYRIALQQIAQANCGWPSERARRALERK